MSGVAVAVGVLCLIWVKDRPAPETTEQEKPEEAGWTPRQAMMTPQFMLVAAAMAVTMFCITTNSSVGFSHLVKLGASQVVAAQVLSVIAITATLVKGISGKICEMISSTAILAVGLVVQAVGNLLLAFASSAALQYAAATVYGLGWGLSYVAGTVVLLDYYGRTTGARILSVVWLVTTIAAAGPAGAGWIADHTGSFAPIFLVYAGALAVLAVPIWLMRQPAAKHRLSVGIG
jgi:MFS family permease